MQAGAHWTVTQQPSINSSAASNTEPSKPLVIEIAPDDSMESEPADAEADVSV
jgi:hypothetical protein